MARLVRAITLADGAIYITHGDAFHPAVAPWSPFAASMRQSFEIALAENLKRLPEDVARFSAAREAMEARRIEQRRPVLKPLDLLAQRRARARVRCATSSTSSMSTSPLLRFRFWPKMILL